MLEVWSQKSLKQKYFWGPFELKIDFWGPRSNRTYPILNQTNSIRLYSFFANWLTNLLFWWLVLILEVNRLEVDRPIVMPAQHSPTSGLVHKSELCLNSALGTRAALLSGFYTRGYFLKPSAWIRQEHIDTVQKFLKMICVLTLEGCYGVVAMIF